MMTIANRLVAGIVAGAVVGSAMSLLVAPKPGKGSKQAVTGGASHWRRKTGGAFQNLRHKHREESQGVIKERRNRHLVITK